MKFDKKNQEENQPSITNETNSYEPFMFCGVNFKDAFELIEICKTKTPREGKYFGLYLKTPLCFDEFDRMEAGRMATFYFFSGSSVEDIEEKRNNFCRDGEKQYRPLLMVDRDKEGYLEKEMKIIK